MTIQTKKNIKKAIFEKVSQTDFIDTHEHLLEEKERFSRTLQVDDWSALFLYYLEAEMLTAGMPKKYHEKFFSREIDPIDKWRLLEPYWPAIKNTGYGQAARISVKELYGFEDLSAKTVGKIQAGYEKLRKPGFYKYVLNDKCRIESCQVNSTLQPYMPFTESQYPELLMQDIGIGYLIMDPEQRKELIEVTGITVKGLDDWHRVIDWWFDKYGKYAVSVKNPLGYFRDINHQRVPAEQVESIFNKQVVHKETVTPEERRQLEDHLFWYTAEKATLYNLPIKFHTGYYAFQDIMPLSRVSQNPASATELCRLGPDDRFIFMHICYPYYEPLIAVAKHYTNAYVDMCWAWIINPVAAKDFLKKYLVAAPANKILTFGGDFGYVESVVGHAAIARWGITLALTELVDENLLTLSDAMELIDPIMHGNARKIFDLDKKTEILKNAEWKSSGKCISSGGKRDLSGKMPVLSCPMPAPAPLSSPPISGSGGISSHSVPAPRPSGKSAPPVKRY